MLISGNNTSSKNRYIAVKDARTNYGCRARLGQIVLAVWLCSVGGVIQTIGLETTAFAQEEVARIVAAIVINQREVDIVELLQAGDLYYISLDDFSRLAQVDVTVGTRQVEIITPLGRVAIDLSELRDEGGILYLDNRSIEQNLLVTSQFNERDQSLGFSIPWQGCGSAADLAAGDRPLEVQISAPSSSISTFRQFAFLSTPNDFDELDGRVTTTLDGRLLGGNWLVRFDNRFGNFEDDDVGPEFDEYFWRRRQGQTRYLVGRQATNLHPLLDNLTVVGAQVGWSNLALDRFTLRTTAGALFPRQSDTVRTLRGEGILAGFAVLRVDGRVIEQQQVGFDGIYEFQDVSLDNARLNEVEILLFDRSNLVVPVEIRTFRFRSSQLLLPTGGISHIVGGGLEIEDNEDFTDRLSGFTQTRWGVTEALTLEGALQNGEGGLQAQAGAIFALGSIAVAELGVGYSSEVTAYSIAVDGEFGEFAWQVLWEDVPDNYFFERDERQRERSFEFTFPVSSRLQLGAVARDRIDRSTDARYVLPTFSWRPIDGLSMRGRPDVDGDYRFNGNWRIDRKNLIKVDVAETTIATYRHTIDELSDVELTADFFRDSQIYSLTYNWRGTSRRNPTLRVGLSIDERQNLQAILGATGVIFPGVLAGIFYEPLTSELEQGEFTVTVTTDLGFIGGGVVPAETVGFNELQGAIAGRIVVDRGEVDLPPFDLGDIQVVVNEARSGLTDEGGRFFIGGVPEGDYIVTLDIENLPFELVPVDSQVVVEVAGGAVTTVNFTVQPEYGLAGRLRNSAGEAGAGVRLQLLNLEGEIIQVGTTDRFGLYRIDRVPPGNYILRVDPDSEFAGDIAPQREVAIESSFLFDIDLQLER